MSVIHNFKECLEWGESVADEPFWLQVYQRAFPTLAAVTKNMSAGDAQNRGIDRVLLLQNGRSLYVDEKKRTRDYGDILLEFVSNDRTGAPGWIEKDLQIDFLAYAFIPSGRCYLFPWHQLRRAWRQMGEEWKKRCRLVTAENLTYKTHSIAVPTEELLRMVARASIIDITPPTIVPAPTEAAP